MLHDAITTGIGECSLCGHSGLVRTYKTSPDKVYEGSRLSREDLLVFHLCESCRLDIRSVAEDDEDDACLFRVLAEVERYTIPVKTLLGRQTTQNKSPWTQEPNREAICVDIKFRLPPDYWDDEDDFEDPGTDNPAPILPGGSRKDVLWN